MLTGGEITRHLVYKVLTTRKPTVREKTDLKKLSKMLLNSLNKGFAEEQWLELVEKIKTLPEKSFTFQVIGSKGSSSAYYYHIFNYEYRYGWNKFKRGLVRFFSNPKKRRQLKEFEFIHNETKDLILDDILFGVNSGLKKNQVEIFSELSYRLGFVVFEIEIDEDTKGNPIMIFNYT